MERRMSSGAGEIARFTIAAAAAAAAAALLLGALTAFLVFAAPALADEADTGAAKAQAEADEEKVETPTLSKQVLEGGTWAEAADASAGEAVSFRLVGTLPSNWDDFDFYYYSFVDEPDEAVVVDLDSVRVVLVDAQTGEETDVTGAFEVSAGEDGSFSVSCEDLKSVVAFAAAEYGDEVVLYYEARMDADELGTGTSGAMVNTAYVVYTSRTFTTALGRTVEDSATLYTWELELLKVSAEDGSALAGAAFTVLDVESGLYLDAAGGLHEDAVAIGVGEDGTLSVVGVDSGTYLICEAQAPEGYLAADDIVVTVDFDAQELTLSAEAWGDDGVLRGVDASGGAVSLLVYDEEEPTATLTRVLSKTGDVLTGALPALLALLLAALGALALAASRRARRAGADEGDGAGGDQGR